MRNRVKRCQSFKERASGEGERIRLKKAGKLLVKVTAPRPKYKHLDLVVRL